MLFDIFKTKNKLSHQKTSRINPHTNSGIAEQSSAPNKSNTRIGVRVKAVPKLMCGFTIIELIVSMTLFIVVTLISVGALLNIVVVNKKVQSVKSVVNNINFVMENMSKDIRFATSYHCDSVSETPPPTPPGLDTPQDCAVASGNYLAYESSGGNRADSGDQIVYRLNGTQIEKSTDGGSNFLGLTAPEVIITELSFFVRGAPASDSLQPRVVIIIRGVVDLNQKSETEFNLQTTVSQREIDS